MKFNPARQALAKWLMTQRRCVGYPSCDGDLVGQLHDDDCPLASVKGSEGRASMVTPETAFMAGWQLAMERKSKALAPVSDSDEGKEE